MRTHIGFLIPVFFISAGTFYSPAPIYPFGFLLAEKREQENELPAPQRCGANDECVIHIGKKQTPNKKKQKGKAQLMAKVWEASWNSSLVAPTDFY